MPCDWGCENFDAPTNVVNHMIFVWRSNSRTQNIYVVSVTNYDWNKINFIRVKYLKQMKKSIGVVFDWIEFIFF